MKKILLAVVFCASFIAQPYAALAKEAKSPVLQAESIAYAVNNEVKVDFNQSLVNKEKNDWNLGLDSRYKNNVGWLYVYDDMLPEAAGLMAWAADIKNQYDHCIVVGMGGSSLSVEVMRVLFGKKKGYPELMILDTSNPDTFIDLESKIDLSRTLFIISSKSGTTSETVYGYNYFFDKVKKVKNNPGDNFIAITDKGSFLNKEAEAKNFKRFFLNRKDIGGRFSALSYFGMVPAAIAGYDIEGILASAHNYSLSLKEGEQLPVILANAISPTGAAKSKRVFLNFDKKLYALGLWIEQLLSESLGKDGKEVVPVVVEKIEKDLLTNDDVIIFTKKNKQKVSSYDNAAFSLVVKNETEIGKVFLLWEFVAAVSGEVMGINPFNQPDVELAKKLAKEMMKQDDATLSKSLDLSGAVSRGYPGTTLEDIFVKAGGKASYITLMLYAQLDKKEEKAVQKFAKKLQDKTKTPVVITYGPRYLHSLGQMHKGGANTGFFIIITNVEKDLFVPSSGSMRKLFLAQAYGDFLAIDEKGGSAVKINLKNSVSLDKYLSGFFKTK